MDIKRRGLPGGASLMNLIVYTSTEVQRHYVKRDYHKPENGSSIGGDGPLRRENIGIRYDQKHKQGNNSFQVINKIKKYGFDSEIIGILLQIQVSQTVY